jgi:1-acyl-sn-glycerol-3-phosphate acyltransferase
MTEMPPIADQPRQHETAFDVLWRVVYGTYAWTLFTGVALITLIGLLLIPGMHRRRRLTAIAARSILRAIGMPLEISGLDRLPLGQCVVAANHASYIDAIVIKAVLPDRFAYVVKREMNDVPLAGLLLRRLGTQFVERFNSHRGALDARRVLRSASNGESLLFFPEGTFETEPGLLRFHSGAFKSAVHAGCPVVPCVIRGTRQILPTPRFFPRPGRIQVELLPAVAIDTQVTPEVAAQQLRDTTRRRILEHLDEPDRA